MVSHRRTLPSQDWEGDWLWWPVPSGCRQQAQQARGGTSSGRNARELSSEFQDTPVEERLRGGTLGLCPGGDDSQSVVTTVQVQEVPGLFVLLSKHYV